MRTRRPSHSIVITSHLCSRSARAAVAEPWFRPVWPPLFPHAPAAAEHHRTTWVATPPPSQDHPLHRYTHTHQNNLALLPLAGHPTPPSHARARRGDAGSVALHAQTPKILHGFPPKHRRACLRNRSHVHKKRLTQSHGDDNDDDDDPKSINGGYASSKCARAHSLAARRNKCRRHVRAPARMTLLGIVRA